MSILDQYRARKAREAEDAKAQSSSLPEPVKLKPEKNLEKYERTTKTIPEPEWKEEWIGMPEFSQERKEPFSKVIVRFETEEDLDEFSEMIGQKLTPKTKSIWHPQVIRGEHSHLVWVDESDDAE